MCRMEVRTAHGCVEMRCEYAPQHRTNTYKNEIRTRTWEVASQNDEKRRSENNLLLNFERAFFEFLFCYIIIIMCFQLRISNWVHFVHRLHCQHFCLFSAAAAAFPTIEPKNSLLDAMIFFSPAFIVFVTQIKSKYKYVHYTHHKERKVIWSEWCNKMKCSTNIRN